MRRTVVRTSFLCLSSFFALALSACVVAPPPYEEFNLARVAVRAAQEVDSARYVPGLWNRADESFRAGEAALKDNDFDKAKEHFLTALQFAEKAENATRLKKFQTGDSFP